MRNLLLASAFLVMASYSVADDGVVPSVAFNDAPALNAPLSGPAFIDPVFPEVADGDPDEELEGLLDYSPAYLPMPEDGAKTLGALGPDAFELLIVDAEMVR